MAQIDSQRGDWSLIAYGLPFVSTAPTYLCLDP